MSEPIRLALIGAGLFAREAHIPALVALQDQYQVVAIASRTLESAQARAAEIPYTVETTTDIPALLDHDDIEVVNVVLPIQVQPPVLEQVIRSGKHIISEKPIARTLTEGQHMIDLHTSSSLWMVAENFRYQSGYMKAAELLKADAIGKPILANWVLYLPLNPGDKYYETAWRRGGDFPGGFLLDGGVHRVAALRLMLGEIRRVHSFATLSRPDCPPLNTIAANLEFENGCIGNYSETYGAAPGAAYTTRITISGTDGLMQVDDGQVIITRDGETRTIDAPGAPNVQAELAAFADSIRNGAPHRGTPQQAMQDVAVVEALLHAAETGQTTDVQRFV